MPSDNFSSVWFDLVNFMACFHSSWAYPLCVCNMQS